MQSRKYLDFIKDHLGDRCICALVIVVVAGAAAWVVAALMFKGAFA